jgi:hypothetical protein
MIIITTIIISWFTVVVVNLSFESDQIIAQFNHNLIWNSDLQQQ